MPAKARNQIIRKGEIGVYHVWSRCAQHEFLCGEDPRTGEDFTYRRERLEKLIQYQTQVFAIDLGTYSILSNHFHLILRSRPDIVETWSDEEVAARWKLAWPAWNHDRWYRDVTDEMVKEVLNDPRKLAQARDGLSSISWYAARIKEPISKMANAEVGKSGVFWSGRFGCRALEDDPAIMTCMAYIDTNQIKAGLAKTLEGSRYSAISLRIEELRRQEAEASVEEFDREKEEFHVYTVEQANAFLATNHLSPISPSGPGPFHEKQILESGVRRPGVSHILQSFWQSERIVVPGLPPQGSPLPASWPGMLWPEKPEVVASTDKEPTGETPADEIFTDCGPADGVPADKRLSQSVLVNGGGGEPECDPPPRAEHESVGRSVGRHERKAKLGPQAGGDLDDSHEQDADVEGPKQPPRRRRRTREVVRRLWPEGLPLRNSDVPILFLTILQYLKVVRWVASNCGSGGEDLEPPPPGLGRVHCKPGKWLQAVENFDQMFGYAVGDAAALRAIAARHGRQWIHGIRHCRAIFGEGYG